MKLRTVLSAWLTNPLRFAVSMMAISAAMMVAGMLAGQDQNQLPMPHMLNAALNVAWVGLVGLVGLVIAWAANRGTIRNVNPVIATATGLLFAVINLEVLSAVEYATIGWILAAGANVVPVAIMAGVYSLTPTAALITNWATSKVAGARRS